MSQQPEIQAMGTPNPKSVKFLTDRTLLPTGSADFRDPEAARRSPLAMRLFDLDGVEGVFICQNFLTVTASSEDVWHHLTHDVSRVLRDFLATGQEAVEGGIDDHAGSDGEIEAKIKEILDSQIRPAVAMDGGDVVFVDYQDGLVRLRMQGACGGCPSATMTLKSGIEARLRHFIPQVERVEAV
jgi:Fe-S cluster biogenesis protein NfuA